MKSIVFSFIIIGITSTNSEVIWPFDAYGLPKAKTGCPKSDGIKWEEGWRKQDMEDDKEWRSEISSNFHMEAKLLGGKKDVNRTFCMKPENGVSKREWPRGFYCVYKSSVSSCPKGMKEGSVKWDDEDKENNNKGKGTLPDGTYNKDTKIKYCCQDEGHWYDVIQLPIDRPFYLLPHSSSSKYANCQVVKWAMTWLEYIVYDTSDYDNSDKFEGSHVFLQSFGGNGLLKMYYCYYKGCGSNTMSGNTGSFTSRNGYPQFQYCSWLVTVSKNRVVLLNFANINVPNCKENFVKIFDGVNDRAPLLTTYCDMNATPGNTIVSTTNNVYVVFKSGTYSKDTEILVGFQAKYTTRLKPTKSTGTTPRSPHVSTSRSTATLLRVSKSRSTATLLRVSVSTSRSTAMPLRVSKSRSTAMSSPTKAIVKTTKPSTSRSSPQAESNSESSHNLPVTYIIIIVIAGVTIILVITIIVICIRRKMKKTVTSNDSRGLNNSDEMRKYATVSNQTDSDCYATPSSPAEKVWRGVRSISREGRNPIYEPGNDTVCCSTDNDTYEAADGAESKNPLYNAPDVHLYTEPTTSSGDRYYDLPETSTELNI